MRRDAAGPRARAPGAGGHVGRAGRDGRPRRRSSCERRGLPRGRRKAEVVLHGFRDGFMPYEASAVKEAFEELKRVEPDLVFTHTRAGSAQDHRLACELTWNTFRDHLVLEYEIPKFDGDLGTPNLFIPVSEDLAREKIDRPRRRSRPSATSTGSMPTCFWASCDCGGWNAARRAGTPRHSLPERCR